MIKVMVAEDERPISRSIIKAIESQNPQFRVDFVAYNGKQAKEFLDTEKIDVVFLDINMPIYDGLWILEYINECNLDVIPVILTGYQEFEYAQRALRLRAFDYLLKPLDDVKLNEILHRIVIERERKSGEEFLRTSKRIPHNIFESKTGLKESCWLASCYLGGHARGELSAETIEKQKQAVAYICHFLESELGENSFWLAEGNEISERILFMNTEVSDYKTVLKQLVTEGEEAVLPLSLAVGNIQIGISEINKTYKILRLQAKNNAKFDRSVIQFVGKEGGNLKNNIRKREKGIEEKKENLLLQKIWANITVEELVKIFDELIMNTGLTRRRVEFAAKSFFIRLCEKVPTQISYLDLEEELVTILENEFYYRDLSEKIKEIIKKYFYMEMEPVENRKELALLMKEYIDCNYSFQFSNQILEEKFGYSAFYLRSAFKEVYGRTPNDYLMQMRLEKAGELLKRSVQVKEVAKEVGFLDPLYFSKVFKKYMGCSPKEYRNY